MTFTINDDEVKSAHGMELPPFPSRKRQHVGSAWGALCLTPPPPPPHTHTTSNTPCMFV